MNDKEKSSSINNIDAGGITDLLLRIAALGILLYACYSILEPFISIMLWAFVLAVSLNPFYFSVRRLFGGKGIFAAVFIVVLFLSILIVPIVWMSISTGLSLEKYGQQIASGELVVPMPSPNIQTIPLIGGPVYEAWSLASTNMGELVIQYKDQLIFVGRTVVNLLASTGKGIVLLLLSIIISGVLLIYGKEAGNFGRAFFVRLVGERGNEMASVAEVTVRNVTKGILGVAFIQSMLAGLGFFIAGIPFAGLWTLMCLFLSVMQIGLLPVSLGVIIYAWTTMNTFHAILLTAWMLFVGIVDNILKPIFLGRKAPVPMIVVFLGAIGGFIHSGFIGLFTGAIILSLAYKLMISWVNHTNLDSEK